MSKAHRHTNMAGTAMHQENKLTYSTYIHISISDPKTNLQRTKQLWSDCFPITDAHGFTSPARPATFCGSKDPKVLAAPAAAPALLKSPGRRAGTAWPGSP